MISAYILPGVAVVSFWTALFLSVVWGLINAVIKPILMILTLPINLLTLGLFTLVINALMVMLAAWVVGGVVIANFWQAVLFCILVTIFSSILSLLTGKD